MFDGIRPMLVSSVATMFNWVRCIVTRLGAVEVCASRRKKRPKLNFFETRTECTVPDQSVQYGKRVWHKANKKQINYTSSLREARPSRLLLDRYIDRCTKCS